MSREVLRDLTLLLGLGLLLLATGLGLRDPWPADEPRFALIARDMVASGDWLFPRVGGDLYQDKPPFYVWLIASAYALTGSLRLSFLLPSLFAGLATLVLVYDLTRRLWNRDAGRRAALVLLFTVQFTLQVHVAQIDAVLCFFITLSLYGLLRHLLLGHGWHWYALGGFAAGLGVITKGVGFLPLLVLLPYAYARWQKWQLPELHATPAQWSIAGVAFVAAVSLWLLPMLLAVAFSDDPALAAYRDEILFQQTVTRYATAWHHRQPYYYFLTVMLSVWLPLIVLLPWLVPRWIERLRKRDVRILLLLGWVAMVFVFFSVSPGKRGVYILPALPALAVASGEWIRGLWQRTDVQRTGAVFALLLVFASAGTFAYLKWLAPERAAALNDEQGLQYIEPLAAIAIVGYLAILANGARRGIRALGWVLGLSWLIVSFTVVPQINASRSAARFIDGLEKIADPGRELGLLAYKEQFLLQLKRPSVNFGHARWREGPLEAYDAARWLNADSNRQLLVAEHNLQPCFGPATRKIDAGTSSGGRWFLVSGPADSDCAAKGRDDRVLEYRPPQFAAPKNRDPAPTS